MKTILRSLLFVSGILLALLQPVFLHAEQGVVSIIKGNVTADAGEQACEKRILEQLGTVSDPEFDITIVDFGLVRGVDCDAQKKINTVTIVPTSPLCPYLKEMVADIKSVSQALYPQREARVIVDLETRWTPALMTEKGKKLFWGDD